MTKINLLPWREELRQQQKKEFGIYAIAAIVFGLAVVGLIHFQVEGLIDGQKSRNRFMQNQIDQMDKKIAEISELNKIRQSMLDRMNIIQDLQRSRPSIVHLFAELVSTVPNGVFLESLAQKDNGLLITGEAESNARVSAYMRNLNKSEWLDDPVLDVIEIEDKKVNRISSFTLRVKQTSPLEQAAAEGGIKTP